MKYMYYPDVPKNENGLIQMIRLGKSIRNKWGYVAGSCSCEFGRWVIGFNAGGQIAREKFYSNPILKFDIPDRGV